MLLSLTREIPSRRRYLHQVRVGVIHPSQNEARNPSSAKRAGPVGTVCPDVDARYLASGGDSRLQRFQQENPLCSPGETAVFRGDLPQISAIIPEVFYWLPAKRGALTEFFWVLIVHLKYRGSVGISFGQLEGSASINSLHKTQQEKCSSPRGGPTTSSESSPQKSDMPCSRFSGSSR